MAGRKPKDQREADDERQKEFDRFEDLTRKLLKVPKEELDKERAKRDREKKRAG
jgi:hypothetical protein